MIYLTYFAINEPLAEFRPPILFHHNPGGLGVLPILASTQTTKAFQLKTADFLGERIANSLPIRSHTEVLLKEILKANTSLSYIPHAMTKQQLTQIFHDRKALDVQGAAATLLLPTAFCHFVSPPLRSASDLHLWIESRGGEKA